jgi:hypothetical protein
MKNGMILGLLAGTCIGLITATMSKDARVAVNKGTQMAKEKMQQLTK